MELFLKGNPDGVVKTGFAHENVSFQPYDSSYELEEDNLKIGLSENLTIQLSI